MRTELALADAAELRYSAACCMYPTGIVFAASLHPATPRTNSQEQEPNTCASRDAQALPRAASLSAERRHLQMEDGPAAVYGGCDDEGVGGDSFGSHILRIPKIHRKGRSCEQQLATLRHVKNLLVGSSPAKRVALGLSLVEDVLAFLDDAAETAAECHHESALLHALGLFAILSCPSLERRLADIYLAPNGSRIVGHIIRAVKWSPNAPLLTSTRRVGGDARLTAIALRAVTSLCPCIVPVSATTTPIVGLVDVAVAPAAKEETVKSVAELRKVSVLIMEKIRAATTAPAKASSWSPPPSTWSVSLISLGVEALATLTRVEELARSVVPIVVSGTMLLTPLLSR